MAKFCDKCKKETDLEKHHILPKSTFGENNEIAYLCPNCHAEYHKKLGKKNLKNPNIEFHIYYYNLWLYGLLSFILILIALVAIKS